MFSRPFRHSLGPLSAPGSPRMRWLILRCFSFSFFLSFPFLSFNQNFELVASMTVKDLYFLSFWLGNWVKLKDAMHVIGSYKIISLAIQSFQSVLFLSYFFITYLMEEAPWCVLNFLRLKCAACFTKGGAAYRKVGHLFSPGWHYIPLTNRVWGPYCKLRTEVFSVHQSQRAY